MRFPSIVCLLTIALLVQGASSVASNDHQSEPGPAELHGSSSIIPSRRPETAQKLSLSTKQLISMDKAWLHLLSSYRRLRILLHKVAADNGTSWLDQAVKLLNSEPVDSGDEELNITGQSTPATAPFRLH
jgi:hypothetical protein